MNRSRLWSALLACGAMSAALALAGCGSNDQTDLGPGDDGGPGAQSDATTGDDGSPSANDDGGGQQGDGGTNQGDGAASIVCGVFGATCATGGDCCSKLCDPSTKKCVSSVNVCSAAGSTCAVSTDCCTGTCVNGVCGATQCTSIGAACTTGAQCCTGNCDATKHCASIVPGATCTTAGNTCTGNAQCCSGLCSKTTGTCALGSSYCIQNNDMCYRADDCCGGICSAPNGQPVSATNPGVCSQPASGGVNCTGMDGALCPGGNCGQCCSRLCAPYGPTGVDICQPAQGCRIEGDLCRKNTDCCGAAGSGVLGAGLVVCSNSINGGAVGVCMTPTASSSADAGNTCVPEGDVCHYTAADYTCNSVSSARSDCCGPQTPKYLACQLDKLGVPRCLATTGVPGDAGTGCVQSGSFCATANDCCNGNPCVPNGQGQFVCSASTCISSGGTCTTNADCCSGLPCILQPGASAGTCGSTTTSTGDAGVTDAAPAPDAAGCTLYGQQCTSSAQCCTGTACTDGLCL